MTPRTEPTPRPRMTGRERREQLVGIGRALFAERGLDATTVEELAQRAGVSKPVVYEHFGGKEGLYAVVVDREIALLTGLITSTLAAGGSAYHVVERTVLALLDYIEADADGFRILVRDSPTGQSTGNFASLISDVATQVEHLLGEEFRARGLDPADAPVYAQALVGTVALVGQWWLDNREPKEKVAAHLVNLMWRGLSGMQAAPVLTGPRGQI